jgi:nucleotide-binding universal stress UspA family protein
MYRKILVPLDGSPTAARGLQEAIPLALTLGARIRLLHVVTSIPWLAAGGMPVAEDVVAMLRSKGASVLREASTSVRAAGVEVEDRLANSLGDDAGQVIVGQALAWGADLIVCGTHGRRGWRRVLMGSDAEYVLRHAPVPVLLVRAPDEGGPARGASRLQGREMDEPGTGHSVPAQLARPDVRRQRTAVQEIFSPSQGPHCLQRTRHCAHRPGYGRYVVTASDRASIVHHETRMELP